MIAIRNGWLFAGGLASAAAAIAHLVCIVGGPSWYQAMGAPPGYVRAAARGAWTPALVTLGIAALLGIWAIYALAGAGLIRRLPLMRTALILITLAYLLRGLVVFRPSLGRPDLSAAFMLWSSLIVLAMGVVHAIGLWRGWHEL